MDSLYVVSEWLRSHDFGDVLYLGIADAASGEGSDDDQDGDDADTFDRFLDGAIIRQARSRLTTERIWRAWASRCGVSPDREEIEGILRREVAQLFRERFSAPGASRGRVDGRVQYYWEGYAIVRERGVRERSQGIALKSGPLTVCAGQSTELSSPRAYLPGGRGVTLS